MKLFYVRETNADTCGNTWDGAFELYVEAESQEEVRKKFPEYRGFGGFRIVEVKKFSLAAAEAKLQQLDEMSKFKSSDDRSRIWKGIRPK